MGWDGGWGTGLGPRTPAALHANECQAGRPLPAWTDGLWDSWASPSSRQGPHLCPHSSPCFRVAVGVFGSGIIPDPEAVSCADQLLPVARGAVFKGLTGARTGSRGGRPTGRSRRAPLELLECPHRGVDRNRRSPGAGHQTPPTEGVWVHSVSRREEQPVPPCPGPLAPGPQPALSLSPGVCAPPRSPPLPGSLLLCPQAQPLPVCLSVCLAVCFSLVTILGSHLRAR